MSRRVAASETDFTMEPMVDVVFMLLTFFLFTFQVKWLETLQQVESVAATAGTVQSAPEQTLRVELQADVDGRLLDIRLDGDSIDDAAALEDRLHRLRTVRPQAHAGVLILSDDALRYEHVIQITAAIARAGWTPRLASEE